VTAVARVLLDSPLPQLDRLFDYRIPDALSADAVPGVRVTVPLRSAGRTSAGWIVEVTDAADFPGTLSELDSVLSPVVVLTPEVWRLARAAATRAAGVASDILRLAIPSRQVRVEKRWLAAERETTTGPAEAPPAPVAVTGYPRLAEAVAAHARLAVDAIPEVVPAGDSWTGAWARTLAELAAGALARGESAILVVPDYRDQHQLEAALIERVAPEDTARLDARQSNADRYRGFLRCLEERPVVVVGTRSAVYAPAHRLGLLALWDDGDPLHAEPLAPYVHARDAALLRQEQSGCALVVIGHARSTEVERLVGIGWLRSMGPEPAVLPRVIPTASIAADESRAASARIPSAAWREAKAALEHGPVLVQVARPGYAPRLACADCGRTARCRRCEGPLAVSRRGQTPGCQWCGALAVDWLCATCEGERFRLARAGSARTADELGRAFPGVRVLLADGDHPVLEVGGDPALVVATRGAEPVAAGGYRAVLLLDGDSMIARESLRVNEDCLRWWSNAAALAARRAPVVLVGVGGAVASALATWRQADFARAELADRGQLRFPPAVRVASVTGQDALVGEAIARLDVPPLDVLGPVPVGEDAVRTIVRFDYAHGAALAEQLKAEAVRLATVRRKPSPSGPRPLRRPTVRVHLDDQEPFLEM
jgi:primosomal protein N' (replication factor Y) (superfamily II helicase)